MLSIPLIGVTTYYASAAWGSWTRPASIVPNAYFELVAAAGGRPILLPHLHGIGEPAGSGVPIKGDRVVLGTSGAAEAINAVDGLVLLGGNDIDPRTYRQDPHREAGGFDPPRDAWEMDLLDHALRRDLPVLAICRGHQLLNVHLGGTLTQHLPDAIGDRVHQPGPGVFADVQVVTAPGSRIERIFGERCTVCCSHHQSIDQLGNGLVTAARATHDNGAEVVEAIEMTDRSLVIGIQWHPEESWDLRPFEALVEVAKHRSALGQAMGSSDGG